MFLWKLPFKILSYFPESSANAGTNYPHILSTKVICSFIDTHNRTRYSFVVTFQESSLIDTI